MDLKVLTYSCLNPESICTDNNVLHRNDKGHPFKIYSREIYKKMEMDYPKFYRMDALCQLAILAAEVLIRRVEDWNGEEVSLVVLNKNSSVVADTRYFQSIKNKKDYFPSPAVFVYTLPNIMLGEICIKHGITGENTCLIAEKFDADFLYEYVTHLMEIEQYRYCITGFIDHAGEDYKAELYLIGEESLQNHFDSYEFDRNFAKKNNNNGRS